MDVYCPTCGEPWEIDTFHEVAEETDSTFDLVRQDFRKRGCVALGMRPCKPSNDLRALASAELMDVLGDDIDGVASLLDDFEYMGMLD